MRPDTLPEHFWNSHRLRLRGAKRAHVIQPKTAAEAVTFHEEELQAAAQPQRLKRGRLERADEAMEWTAGDMAPHLQHVLGSAQYQDTTLFLGGGEEQLDSASLAMADLAARMAVTDAGVHQYLQREGLRDQILPKPKKKG